MQQKQNAEMIQENDTVEILVNGYRVTLNFLPDPCEDVMACVNKILVKSLFAIMY